MSDVWLLRIGILVAGVILFGAIWYFGTRPRGQAAAHPGSATTGATHPRAQLDAIAEPHYARCGGAARWLLDSPVQHAGTANPTRTSRREDFDKIVTLSSPRARANLARPDIVVAAEGPA